MSDDDIDGSDGLERSAKEHADADDIDGTGTEPTPPIPQSAADSAQAGVGHGEGFSAAGAPGPAWYGPPPQAWPGVAQDHQGRIGRLVRNVTIAWVVAGVLLLAVVGLATALATTGTQAPVRAVGPFAGSGVGPGFGRGGGFGGIGSSRGVAGTVASVSSGSFTVSTLSGQTVIVDEQSSTIYDMGATSASASAVTKGAHVLVLGTRSGTTVTAARVVVLPAGPGVSSPR